MKLALARAILFEVSLPRPFSLRASTDVLLPRPISSSSTSPPTTWMFSTSPGWRTTSRVSRLARPSSSPVRPFLLRAFESLPDDVSADDSGFLNNVTTDILHLHRFKVKRYPGNLEAFVKHVPEAKAYYELAPADDYLFKFPDPPLLDVRLSRCPIACMSLTLLTHPGSQDQGEVAHEDEARRIPVPHRAHPAALRHLPPGLALVACRRPRTQRIRKVDPRQAPRRRG